MVRAVLMTRGTADEADLEPATEADIITATVPPGRHANMPLGVPAPAGNGAVMPDPPRRNGRTTLPGTGPQTEIDYEIAKVGQADDELYGHERGNMHLMSDVELTARAVEALRRRDHDLADMLNGELHRRMIVKANGASTDDEAPAREDTDPRESDSDDASLNSRDPSSEDNHPYAHDGRQRHPRPRERPRENHDQQCQGLQRKCAQLVEWLVTTKGIPGDG